MEQVGALAHYLAEHIVITGVPDSIQFHSHTSSAKLSYQVSPEAKHLASI